MRGTLAVAAIVALAIAGCGRSDGSSTSTSPTPTTTPTATTSTSSTSTTSTVNRKALRRRTGKAYSQLGPEQSVQAALTSSDPALACGQLITEDYLRTAYGSERGCIAAVRSGSQASSVRIVSVDLAGSTATVKVVPADGPSAGDTLTVSMVHEHSDAVDATIWKVDAVRSNAPVGP